MRNFDLEKVKIILQEVAAEHILPFFRKLKAKHIASRHTGQDGIKRLQDNESYRLIRVFRLLKGLKKTADRSFRSNRGNSKLFFDESPMRFAKTWGVVASFAASSSESARSLLKQNNINALRNKPESLLQMYGRRIIA